MDLLRMNVAPTAIDRMLKSIISSQKKRQTAASVAGNVPASSSTTHGTATSSQHHSWNAFSDAWLGNSYEQFNI